MNYRNLLVILILFGPQLTLNCKISPRDDRYRPKIHFSISKHWINDPNGLVYLDGEYHLHYQYNPLDSVWGPMHWGHSVSKDLIHWTELPIALYPDDLGQMFSGSAVADLNNTAGFKNGPNTPIVAMFTNAGNSQQQSIAYSNDKGRTYEKYVGNPVISNPGLQDFRDPKIIRYNNSWLMVLAAGNKVIFYKSNDLKSWTLTGEFGANPEQGAHTGVWECPDLLRFQLLDKTVAWVLIVSINPGGPNGGSVTQYFVGEFNGEKFISSQTDPLWMDWGVDNYAAVSFSNEPHGRYVLMGWMNNWNYGNVLPTNGWRGQMTLPRVMSLRNVNGKLRLASYPVPEIAALINSKTTTILDTNYSLLADSVYAPAMIQNGLVHLNVTFETKDMSDGATLAICFLNDLKQEVCVGYDKGQDMSIFLNRELSGLTDFSRLFSGRHTAKREIASSVISFDVFVDVSAIEMFADSGLTCMTALFYPDKVYNKIEIRHHANGNDQSVVSIISGYVQGMKSIF